MGKREKQEKTEPCQQMHIYLSVLLSATFINIIVFYTSTGSPHQSVCSSDNIVQVLAMYITNNSYLKLEDYIPKECLGFKESSEIHLAETIRDVVNTCRIKRDELKKRKTENPLVTLFTTYAGHVHSDDEKFVVHNNTFLNWARLQPKVKLILFANKTYMKRTDTPAGWEIMSSSVDDSSDTSPPVLKEMFDISMKRFDTPWYGYVNADILFTDNFLEVLEEISDAFNINSTRILVTGRRTNVENVTTADASSSQRLTQRSAGVPKYREDAEDYFITTKLFPWQHIAPVVVGRPAYDNWLVGAARCDYNTTVIDVSDTVLAIHQTTLKGGNHEGYTHKERNFNFEVFKKYNITPNYIAGLTSCAQYRSFKNFCDTVSLSKRDRFGPGCSCKKKGR